VEDVRRLLMSCSTENRERLARLIGDRVREREYLIVRLPRPSGGAALFGIQFDGVQALHPLANGGEAQRLTPIVIERRDKRYLVQRGGGHMELADRRVLLIGCGAIGGHLAFELSRAGIEELMLVDHDVLGPANTYRHVLGKRYWGKKKADALKQEIRLQLPFSRALAVTETIETALASNVIQLNDYDLIICALGNPTSQLALNERVRSSEGGPPILFTWLDPYGIGGHTILTGMNGSSGCFECLYTEELHNRVAFAEPGQTFHRSLAGCDSLHTPYGSLDAAQTAHLAARLAIDMLIGREQQNRLRSWKGNQEAFTAAGFNVAHRYELSANELAQQETHFANPTCRICGERKNESCL
jgi:molybdopterin/thiamine biosynthesis adenylyltransferase